MLAASPILSISLFKVPVRNHTTCNCCITRDHTKVYDTTWGVAVEGIHTIRNAIKQNESTQVINCFCCTSEKSMIFALILLVNHGAIGHFPMLDPHSGMIYLFKFATFLVSILSWSRVNGPE